MAPRKWQRTITPSSTARYDAASGVLQVNGCCLSSGSEAALYCSVNGGPTFALARVAPTRPHCRICMVLGEDTVFSCIGGDVVVNGVLKADPDAVATAAVSASAPPAKKAKTSEDEERRAALREAQAEAARRKAEKLEAEKMVAQKKAAEEAAAEKAAAKKAKEERRVAAEQAAKKLEVERLKAEKLRAEQLAAAKKAKEAAGSGASQMAKVLPSGLKYIVQRPGKGAKATPGQTVQVKYDGKLARGGKRFDKGMIKFRLGRGEVIKGWDEGVKGMLVGEQRKLLIPSQLAYGARGAPPDIPKHAELVFDVELLRC